MIEIPDDAYGRYIGAHPEATYCHDPAWAKVIRDCYGKKPRYLVVKTDGGVLAGVLPACLLNSRLLGNRLVSMPYLDWGGILAESPEAEDALLQAFLRLAARHRASAELRCSKPLANLAAPPNQKVGMILDLGGSDEDSYWKKLGAKVRNQIRKAEKSQVTLQWGRHELIDDFYAVFSRNMRDLGSPVHSRGLFEKLLGEFPGAEIGTAYRGERCIGGLVRILWRDTLAIPWASTLRAERVHCPNNVLYWESIRFAFRKRCRQVDFGRSTRQEGTWHFKMQWLAREIPLPWYQFDKKGRLTSRVRHASSGPMAPLARIWARLPLKLANALGPRLRGMIPA